MLVITRHTNERIVVGDPANPIATIELVEIGRNRARIGIIAGRDTQVNRKEVADRILQERSIASKEAKSA